MKNILKATFGMVFGLLASSPAHADLYVVVLSSLHKQGTEQIGLTLGNLAKTVLEPGDTVVVMDGTDAKEIATLPIPKENRFKSAKFRLNFLKKNYRKIAAYQRAQKDKTDGQASNDLAGLFREIGDSVLTTYSGEPAHVIAFLDPIHHDPRRPLGSMRGGQYFNDGHIRASSQVSDFGVADRANHFKGVKLHFCVAPDVTFTSNLYEEIVERGWSLYISGQSGTLATFTQDTALCVRRLIKNSDPARSFSLKPEEQQPIMLRLLAPTSKPDNKLDRKPASSSKASNQSKKTKVQAIKAQPAGFLQSNVRINRGAALNTKGRLKVGIRWRCACDLDLYVQHRGASRALSYKNKSSSIGRFHKDLTTSQNSDRAYEFVEFTKAVDARDLAIKVNFYRGTAFGGAKGDVRIWLEGQEGVWEVPFHIKASSGNFSKQSANSMHWVSLDPLTILGLRK